MRVESQTMPYSPKQTTVLLRGKMIPVGAMVSVNSCDNQAEVLATTVLLGLPICLAMCALVCVLVGRFWEPSKPVHAVKGWAVASVPPLLLGLFLLTKYHVFAAWPELILLGLLPSVVTIGLLIFRFRYRMNATKLAAALLVTSVIATGFALLLLGIDDEVFLAPLLIPGMYFIPTAIVLGGLCYEGKKRKNRH